MTQGLELLPDEAKQRLKGRETDTPKADVKFDKSPGTYRCCFVGSTLMR